MLQSFGITDKGSVRSENQDRIFIDQALGVFAVADGMGGHSHGETAAELAISTLRYYLESSQDRFDVTWPYGYKFDLSIDANRLVTAVQLANQQVWRYAQEKPEHSGMGTTVAAVLSGGSQVVIANVGDSRIYRFRDPELELLSFDDTFVNSVARHGQLTTEQIQNHPMRNVLTQAAGTQEVLEVHVREFECRRGDCFLICSDGLHSVISDEAIRQNLEAIDNLESTSVRLIDAAKSAGAPDNISCILLRFSS